MDDTSKFYVRIPDAPVKPVSVTMKAIREAVINVRNERLRKSARRSAGKLGKADASKTYRGSKTK